MLSFLLHEKIALLPCDFGMSEYLCQVFIGLLSFMCVFSTFWSIIKFFSRFDSTFDINKRADSMRYFERLGPELPPQTQTPTSIFFTHAEAARRLRGLKAETDRLHGELTRDRMR